MNASGPLTVKPGTNNDANQKQKPFTMNENKPKLKKLIGRDRIERIGRMTELTAPTTTAASIAAGKLAISTPGTTKSTTSNPNAVAIVVTKNPIIFMFIPLPPELNQFWACLD